MDLEIVKRYTEKLVGVKAACGVIITSISTHAFQRFSERDISEDDAYDLTVNSPIIYTGNTKDTICQQKGNLRMVIDSKTGKIVSVVRLVEEEYAYMDLSNSQQDFLSAEFGLSRDNVLSMKRNELIKLREKCFDIEVEEAVKADGGDGDLSDRGKVATNLVDIFYNYLQSKKMVTV